MMTNTGIFIQWPWATVQRHLKGKHNQKEHGKRGGARQLELFDRDEYVDTSGAEADRARAEQEQIFQNKKRKYAELGVAEAGADNENIFMVWMDEAEEGWNNQSGGYIELDDFIDKTFNYTDYDTGLMTSVTELDADDYGIYVRGEVRSMDGEKVGTFERGITDGVVDHAYFEMYSDAQGKGFGAKFYKHLEESYYDAGLAEVTIHANIDVGGYAWAKMGYDFQNRSDQEFFFAQIEDRFTELYGSEPDDSFYGSKFNEYLSETLGWAPEHAWEMAAFEGPDGTRIGKEILLGSDWMAYKSLAEGDPTWEAGQSYYRSKGL